MVFVRGVALLFVALLGFPLFVAGCSAGGGSTPPAPIVDPNQTSQFNQNPAPLDAGASNVATQTTTMATATATATAPPSGSYTIHANGQIVAVFSSTEFQMQGGDGIGYINVYLTSTTSKYYNGLAPKAGVTADVYGTGSARTSITAKQIALSGSSPSPTTASPDLALSTVTAGVRKHVMTTGVFWGYGGTPTTVPISAASEYYTWVMTSGTYIPQMHAVGLKVAGYVNFWRNYTSDYPIIGYDDLRPGGAHAAAEARTCSGTVIHDPTYGGGYEADARSLSTIEHAKIVIGRQTADAVFSDDTGAIGGIPAPCGFTIATYQAATNRVDAAIPYRMLLNVLGAGRSALQQVGYATAPNVLGAMCELCITANGPVDVARLNGVWDDTENAEVRMVQLHKIFWLYARASGPATEYRLRNYTITSFLLTYDPNYAMLQEAFATAHRFPVMPESGLVPMNPLTTATSVYGYARPGGTYMREFGNCYYRGVNHGRCAVVVNPSSYTRPIPTTAYAHSMVLSGSGVLDGGTVNFSGGRPSWLPSGSGVVLFR